MARLSGLNVLLVGAGPRLGQAVTGRLVAEGATVVVAGPDGGDDTDTDTEPDGRVRRVAFDAADAGQWAPLVAELTATGPLHGVVLCASERRVGRLSSLRPDELGVMIDANLRAPTMALGATAPLLAKSGGGSVVVVASAEAMRAARGAAALAATHWALRGLSRSAALELGADGIRVNLVCPTLDLVANSPSSGDGPAPALTDGGVARAATEGDVAATIAFLLSDDSATCTGGEYLVDAGATP